MRDSGSRKLRFPTALSVVLMAFMVVGCEDGKDGLDGADGADGAGGPAGLNCWDLNENGIGDPAEDLNADGVVDVLDCNALASGANQIAQLHVSYFTEHDYEGTESCMNCHGPVGEEMLTNAHFTWQGVSANITDYEGDTNGKTNLINNFCIAVPSNEGRCTHCHAGYGWDDNTFSGSDRNSVDCLICHDQSGSYKKGKTSAGLPDPAVDLDIVARSVALNNGVPTNDNCIFCHANAGGGDNVKHGDLAMAIANTTRDFDVHMGTDGADFDCVECHQVMKDAGGEMLDHGIGGMPIHSIDDGDMKGCIDCHGDQASTHAGLSVQPVTDAHGTLACQVCHIPAFARNASAPTKMEWYWEDAGKAFDPPPPNDPATGKPTWDNKKGTFVWANDVRPELLYFDGKWDRMMINKNDQYTALPVVLAKPTADYTTPGAMIYPFKKMIGNQPADAGNQTMLVPHLFGPKGGPNAFWGSYDWNLALQDGATYNGQTYTGAYDFVDTVMYLTVNHEIAPKEQALGMDSNCGDCHLEGQIEWTELGWSDDPLLEGTRP